MVNNINSKGEDRKNVFVKAIQDAGIMKAFKEVDSIGVVINFEGIELDVVCEYSKELDSERWNELYNEIRKLSNNPELDNISVHLVNETNDELEEFMKIVWVITR